VTSLGRFLSDLPVDIPLGKMLVFGSMFHQIDTVLSLAAVLSVQSPFTNRAFRDPDCEVGYFLAVFFFIFYFNYYFLIPDFISLH
jgi:HrpA-like helicases